MENPMSDVADTAIGQGTEAGSEAATPTFAERVNTIAGQTTKGDDGKWQLPEGDDSEEMHYAVVSELRRRDTQSALGKSQHSEQTTALENKALKGKLVSTAQISITAEERTELDELKFSDPDAWRNKMNELETRAADQLTSDLAEVSSEVTQESELIRREKVLTEFNAANPDLQLNDDVIFNDVPPRITNKLKNDEVTFEAYLEEVKTYLGKSKVIKNEANAEQPNLGKIGGGANAGDAAVSQDIESSYKDETY
jgi:phage terminase Nu1 subunit (DNA packaging protein)